FSGRAAVDYSPRRRLAAGVASQGVSPRSGGTCLPGTQGGTPVTKLRTRLNVTALDQRDLPSTTNLFDANFYLKHNPDVASAVQRGVFASAEDHFRRRGDAEGRSGNAIFDAKTYLDD